MHQHMRRDLFKTIVLVVVLLMVSVGSAEMVGNGRVTNLLIIHTDQQSCWTLGCYGGKLVATPHIDSLAKEGALFRNFFTNSAVCTPSRGCLLTGRYPHAHGAYVNNIELNRDEVTLARVLERNGYETGYAGKWHLAGEAKPGWVKPGRSMGFADCRFMFNRGHWKKIVDKEEGDPEVFPYREIGDEKTYSTDWLATKTIEFIRRGRKKPFFYMLSIPDPHGPFTVRSPYDTMFKPEDMPIPSTFDASRSTSWAKRVKMLTRHGTTPAERKAWLRKVKAQYCGQVKCIDDNVGRILKCLRETDQLDNTLVVFTTDHGEYMGEHGLMSKNQLYETAYRLPLLIRWPKRIGKGTVIENVVSTVDFQPTILGLLGLAKSGREQGRDASGLLLGKKMDWKDEAFIHHSSLKRAGIFTAGYELAYFKDNEHILFDRIRDPEQVKNLFYDPAYQKVVDELTERVIRHNERVKAPAAEWLKLEAKKRRGVIPSKN
ncbi:MAG: sulfatase family protein [Planctomycetota bacterium]|jgi:arylsulfatase A-like enzyme